MEEIKIINFKLVKEIIEEINEIFNKHKLNDLESLYISRVINEILESCEDMHKEDVKNATRKEIFFNILKKKDL